MAQLHRYKGLYSPFKKSGLQNGPGKQEGCRFDSSPASSLCCFLQGYRDLCRKRMSWSSSESLTHTSHTQSSWPCWDQGRSGSRWRENWKFNSSSDWYKKKIDPDRVSEEKQHFRSFRGDNSVTCDHWPHMIAHTTQSPLQSLALSLSLCQKTSLFIPSFQPLDITGVITDWIGLKHKQHVSLHKNITLIHSHKRCRNCWASCFSSSGCFSESRGSHRSDPASSLLSVLPQLQISPLLKWFLFKKPLISLLSVGRRFRGVLFDLWH